MCKPYGRPVDVYSFSMITYNIIEMRAPWAHLKGNVAVRHACNGERPPISRSVDRRISGLMVSCLWGYGVWDRGVWAKVPATCVHHHALHDARRHRRSSRYCTGYSNSQLTLPHHTFSPTAGKTSRGRAPRSQRSSTYSRSSRQTEVTSNSRLTLPRHWKPTPGASACYAEANAERYFRISLILSDSL